MRKPRPFKWIEEAEARRVVTAALSEASFPSSSARPMQTASYFAIRFRFWPVAATACLDDEAPIVRIKRLHRL